MAVGDYTLPPLAPVPGVRVATVAAGIKKPGRDDLVLLEACEGSAAAGVFTRNAFCAAPVRVAREHLRACEGHPRYLLINTGNANAGIGDAGIAAARLCIDAVAGQAGVPPAQILPFSTGVIGEPLPARRICDAVPALFKGLAPGGWEDAAAGIMTTDTRPKGDSVRLHCDGRDYVVTGIAKGAGMLRPDMATMLAFLATDMAVAPALLQSILREAVGQSFNRITVDGDTSTNDAAMLLATGAAGNEPLADIEAPLYGKLSEAVTGLCRTLARELVRDGEGAGKLVAVHVTGGRGEAECLQVAYTIAHSPLVKTAFFAGDPNWGRLLAAIGRAGVVDLDIEAVSLSLNGTPIAERGARAPGYSEEQGVAAMAPEEINVTVDLGRGDARATVYTSDLSYDYVRINAEYRT